MSDLRYNIMLRNWVIIASERAKRPHDFKKKETTQEAVPKYKDDCPFCPGNEELSKPEIFRIGDDKSWKVRVVYNKFPALSDTIKEERKTAGPYKWLSGFGVHEVIIEHPYHNTAIPLMSDKEVADIIRVYKNRYDSLEKKEGIQAIIIFKNHGVQAGCSLAHPHSQIIATPVVPHQIPELIENTISYFDVTGKCMICQMLEHELMEKRRLVYETDRFVSFVPYASISPFIINIIPRRHAASFGEITEDEMNDLARNLKVTLGKLYHGLGNPDFNYSIRTVPVKEKWPEAFHWHLTIIPRISQPAGFELGSGMFINASIPEDSAAFLRQVETK